MDKSFFKKTILEIFSWITRLGGVNQFENVAIAETKEGRKAHYLLRARLALLNIMPKIKCRFLHNFFHVFHGFDDVKFLSLDSVQWSCKIFQKTTNLTLYFVTDSIKFPRFITYIFYTINLEKYFMKLFI